MTSIIRYTIGVLLLWAIGSCKRQTLEHFHYSEAEVPITIDWSQSQLPDNYVENISIYFYSKEGGLPYITITGQIDSTAVTLPVGYYSVIIFNDAIGNIGGTNFNDDDYYSLFSANTIADTLSSDSYYELQDGDMIIEEHHKMAVWQIDEFAVTTDAPMCSCIAEGYDDESLYSTATQPLLNIQPMPITATNTINVRVINLINASSIEGALIGSASGAYLATNSRISTLEGSNVYLFDFTSRTYDTDSEDGIISAEVITFGKQPTSDASYQLELNIILASGVLASFEYDVTEQVINSDELNIVIDLTDQENQVELPELATSSFGVDDWGDGNHFELL
ncbi:MAG: DUF5119 domain-containing protein [Rikenellaceae bacterium]